MTAKEIATALCNSKGITPDRIARAQALAARMRVDWTDVLDAMTPEQRGELK